MDLGLEQRASAVYGQGALADLCTTILRREGAKVRRDPADPGGCDILVEVMRVQPDLPLAAIDEAAATEAWTDLVAFAQRARAVLPGMQERNWGRIIWVGPLTAKTLEQADGDLDRILGLGMFGLLKAMSGELGRHAITCNSVLADISGGDEGAAATVAFLASARASFVTGTVTAIDGGSGKGIF